MKTLTRGQKVPLSDLTSSAVLRVALAAAAPGLKLDFACFGVNSDGKLADERYFIFYNQKSSPEGAIRIAGERAGEAATFEVDLQKIPAQVRRLVFVFTLDGAGEMRQISGGRLAVLAGGVEVARFDFAGRDFGSEKSIMAGEIYWKDGWRIAAVGQGFREGLSALLKHFGGQDSKETSIVPSLKSIVPASPAPAPLNTANECSDCGKLLTLLERGKNSLMGDRRCTACDRLHKQRLQFETQQRANAQIEVRRRLIERILNGELPNVPPQDAGIVLKRGESCFYVSCAEFHEERVTSTVRVRHRAGGRIRICGGVSYNFGATHGRSIPIAGMVKIDDGMLIITNQRCVFNGSKKSFSVPFAKLISFEPFADGLELNPENKKTQQYKIPDGELAAAILSTALNF